MKYRRLTLEELEELETEFVRFLASNSVTSDDWVKIKTKTPEKAEKLLDIFSDIVFEKIIQKVNYLDHRSKNDLKLFECLDDTIKLVGIKVVGVDSIDFTQSQTSEEMMQQFRQAPQGSVKMYSAQKAYKDGDRSMELFNMMQSGALISDGKLYEMIKEFSK